MITASSVLSTARTSRRLSSTRRARSIATAVWRAMPSAIVMSRCVNVRLGLRRANSITPKNCSPLVSGAISTAGTSTGATCRLSDTGTTTQWPRRRTHSKSGTCSGESCRPVAVCVESPCAPAATARTYLPLSSCPQRDAAIVHLDAARRDLRHRLQDVVEPGETADRLAHGQQRVRDRSGRGTALGALGRARERTRRRRSHRPGEPERCQRRADDQLSEREREDMIDPDRVVHERGKRNDRDEHGAVGELEGGEHRAGAEQEDDQRPAAEHQRVGNRLQRHQEQQRTQAPARGRDRHADGQHVDRDVGEDQVARRLAAPVAEREQQVEQEIRDERSLHGPEAAQRRDREIFVEENPGDQALQDSNDQQRRRRAAQPVGRHGSAQAPARQRHRPQSSGEAGAAASWTPRRAPAAPR